MASQKEGSLNTVWVNLGLGFNSQLKAMLDVTHSFNQGRLYIVKRSTRFTRQESGTSIVVLLK